MRASGVTVGHAESMPLAFANLYVDLAEAIRAGGAGPLLPTAKDGLRSVAAIHAVAESGRAGGEWIDFHSI